MRSRCLATDAFLGVIGRAARRPVSLSERCRQLSSSLASCSRSWAVSSGRVDLLLVGGNISCGVDPVFGRLDPSSDAGVFGERVLNDGWTSTTTNG